MATSHHLSARILDEFAPTCPSESTWYACPASSKSTFVGCCSSDPCASANGCSQGNLRPVSFNAASFGTPAFPPDTSCATGSNFFTCVGGEPTDATRKTFWGCCKSNPCATAQECPAGDLVASYMGTPSQAQAYTGEGGNSASPSPSPSPSPPAESKSGTKNTAVIVGGAVGGAVVIVAIISVLIFFLCRRRKARSRGTSPVKETMSQTDLGTSRPGEKSAAYNSQLYGNEEALPTYTSPNPNAHPAILAPISGYNKQQQHQYQQVDQHPQELPAEMSSAGPSTQRYSELPAEVQTMRVAEMESPGPSPQPQQGAFGGDNGSPHIAELASPQMSPRVPQTKVGEV